MQRLELPGFLCSDCMQIRTIHSQRSCDNTKDQERGAIQTPGMECLQITASGARPDSDISQRRHTKMRIYADMNAEIHICKKQTSRESRWRKSSNRLSVTSEITPS